MVVNLVLARHGQSEWHRDDRYAGRSDIGLTAQGRREAEVMARWAETAGLDAVWSSGLRRALDTAAPAARAIGGVVQVDERLAELDFGIAEGLSRAELSVRYPDELEAFQRDPVAHHFRDGEHPKVAAERYLEVFDDFARRHPGSRVLVVAHSTAIRLALCRLLDIDLNRYRRALPTLLNCGLTEVAVHPDHASLLRFNCPVADTPTVEETP